MVSLSSLSQVAVEHAMAVYANEYSTPDIDESVLQHMSEDEIRTVTLARQLDAHNTGLKQVQTPARARAPMDEAPMDETPMRLRLRLHAVCMLCALQRPSSSTSRRASWCRTSCTAEPRKPMKMSLVFLGSDPELEDRATLYCDSHTRKPKVELRLNTNFRTVIKRQAVTWYSA